MCHLRGVRRASCIQHVVRRHRVSCVSVSSSSCRASTCCASSCHVARRCRRVVHHPSTSYVVCQRVIDVVAVLCVVVPCRPSPSLSSCCAWTCRRCRDAVALAICVMVVPSCRPSSVNVVHRASSCRASSCVRHVVVASVDVLCVVVSCVVVVVHGHVVVVGSCVVRHASLCRHRRRDAMAMAICVVSSSSCRRVVRACRLSWVVVVIVMSCGVGRCGSSVCQCRRREFERDIPPGYHHLRRRLGSSSSLVVGASTMQVVGSSSFVVVAGGAGDGRCQ